MGDKSWKYRTVTLGILVGLLAGLTGCGEKKVPDKVPELVDPVGVDIDTAVVKKMDLSSVNSYQGEVVPDMVGVYFANSGKAGAVKVEIGDKVKKGQILATLFGSETSVKELQEELSSQLDENTELNESSKRKIEQLRIELKEIEKQKTKEKNKKEKSNLNKQMVSKQEEIKTEKLRLKMQKQSQALHIK